MLQEAAHHVTVVDAERLIILSGARAAPAQVCSLLHHAGLPTAVQLPVHQCCMMLALALRDSLCKAA